jgi:hypothetical protein
MGVAVLVRGIWSADDGWVDETWPVKTSIGRTAE